MEQIILQLSNIFTNCIENRDTNTTILDSTCFIGLSSLIDQKYINEISIFNRIFKKIELINDNLNQEYNQEQKDKDLEKYIKFINVFINILNKFKPIDLPKEEEPISVPYLEKYLTYKKNFNQTKYYKKYLKYKLKYNQLKNIN